MQLLKERGVKSDKRAPVPEPAGEIPGPFRGGPPSRTEAINPLAAVIQRLERAVGMVSPLRAVHTLKFNHSAPCI